MKEYTSGNIQIRGPMFFEDGPVEGHKHNFDHTTFVLKGAVLIEKLDDDGNVVKSVIKRATDGYNWVLILAGVCHRLTAVEEGSCAICVYSHRNPQGEVVDNYDGWPPAYV